MPVLGKMRIGRNTFPHTVQGYSRSLEWGAVAALVAKETEWRVGCVLQTLARCPTFLQVVDLMLPGATSQTWLLVLHHQQASENHFRAECFVARFRQ